MYDGKLKHHVYTHYVVYSNYIFIFWQQLFVNWWEITQENLTTYFINYEDNFKIIFIDVSPYSFVCLNLFCYLDNLK